MEQRRLLLEAAEIAGEYLSKGSNVTVEGTLKTGNGKSTKATGSS